MATEQYIIPREGERDLRFTGEHLGKSTSWTHSGSNNNRWAEIVLYKTKGGKYVSVETYVTLWEGESDSSVVYILDKLEAVLDHFEEPWEDYVKEFLKNLNILGYEDIE